MEDKYEAYNVLNDALSMMAEIPAELIQKMPVELKKHIFIEIIEQAVKYDTGATA